MNVGGAISLCVPLLTRPTELHMHVLEPLALVQFSGDASEVGEILTKMTIFTGTWFERSPYTHVWTYVFHFTYVWYHLSALSSQDKSAARRRFCAAGRHLFSPLVSRVFSPG